MENLEVVFDLISINLAGQAIWDIDRGVYRIRINPMALIEYQEEYINDTVTHEYAHIVQRIMSPDSKPHGKEWRMLMKAFGNSAPSVTHSYDLEGVILCLTQEENNVRLM